MKKTAFLNLIVIGLLILSKVVYSQTDSLIQISPDSLIYIDSTNIINISTTGNVGIGTSSPSEKLEVVGNSIFSGKMRIDSTVTIKANLEVDGNTWLKGQLSVDSMSYFNDTSVFYKPSYFKGLYDEDNNFIKKDELIGISIDDHGLLHKLGCDQPGYSGYAYWVSGLGKLFTRQCEHATKVGIGTEVPVTNLDVNGNALISYDLNVGSVDNDQEQYPSNLFVKTSFPKYKAVKLLYSNSQVYRKFFIVPKLENGSYNAISTKYDMGIFWSNTTSYDDSSALIIAPHCSQGVTGIKIGANGNMGICAKGVPGNTENIPNDTRLVISAPSQNPGYFVRCFYGSNTQIAIDKTGKIFAKEVEVKSTLPDYVFDNDYSLISIKDLDSFIKLNNHLPGVPSATEAVDNGVNLGDMNHILLKKIEELTLYIIKQQASIEELQNKVNNLSQKQDEK